MPIFGDAYIHLTPARISLRETKTRQSSTCCRDFGTKERESERRSYYRHAVQTVSERKATLQWKSTRERRAETPEERETRNGSSAIPAAL